MTDKQKRICLSVLRLLDFFTAARLYECSGDLGCR
jgi:hypothetical protein